MNELVIALGWAGVCAAITLAAIRAMLETESRHGRYLGILVMPSPQATYGIVVMFTRIRPVTAETGPALFGIGTLAGLALMVSAIRQGHCCVSVINATKVKPEVFGLSLAPAAVVEGFAIFAFVFALVPAGSIPAAACPLVG